MLCTSHAVEWIWTYTVKWSLERAQMLHIFTHTHSKQVNNRNNRNEEATREAEKK